MFSSIPERTMRLVRTTLAVGWVVLIASLLWDPLTPNLTAADEIASPFRLTGESAVVQGRKLPEQPYAMGARIFWTMALPLIPIFLMLFGHEAWRRICPLSHIMQIPRRLGTQFNRKFLNRRTGKVERKLNLLSQDSWLRRNHLYVQLGLLFVGMSGRLLFYNSDREALFIFFVGVIAAVLLIGYLFGGKTWCNYICPVSVIQKIYTGPGGVLESKAHEVKVPIAQSTCRAPNPGAADRSICVGCTSNCPDIDLEGSYWRSLHSEPKRFMYYAFFGLMLGFYVYYVVYSGNWAYYMSGAWTHEEGQLSTLFAPGIVIAGRELALPKIVAAPLFLALCALASYAFFRFLENFYASIRRRAGHPLTQAQLRHQSFTFVGFISITVFYVFAGRPNVLLMPEWGIRLIDATILFVATAWLWKSWQRDPDLYQRESLAASLRSQLAEIAPNIEALLEGRNLKELSADEVYVLAKTLPEVSAAQKQTLYRGVLSDALEAGHTRSEDSLGLMRDLRSHLGLSDEDHTAMLDALILEDSGLRDGGTHLGKEDRIRRANYREYIYNLLEEAKKSGQSGPTYLQRKDIASDLQSVRAAYSVDEVEHGKILTELLGGVGSLLRRAERQLAEAKRLATLSFSLVQSDEVGIDLLLRAMAEKRLRVTAELLQTLREIDDADAVVPIAQALYAITGSELKRHQPAIDAMPENLAGALSQKLPTASPVDYADVIRDAVSPSQTLENLLNDVDPVVQAVALETLSFVAPNTARSKAAELDSETTKRHRLLARIVAALVAGQPTGLVDKMNWLARIDLFAHLSLSELGELAFDAHYQEFPKGTVICREGDASDAIFMVREGLAEASHDRESRSLLLGDISVGQVFGELGILSNRTRTATVTVKSEKAVVLQIDGDRFKSLLDRDARIARHVTQAIVEYVFRERSDEANQDVDEDA